MVGAAEALLGAALARQADGAAVVVALGTVAVPAVAYAAGALVEAGPKAEQPVGPEPLVAKTVVLVVSQQLEGAAVAAAAAHEALAAAAAAEPFAEQPVEAAEAEPLVVLLVRLQAEALVEQLALPQAEPLEQLVRLQAEALVEQLALPQAEPLGRVEALVAAVEPEQHLALRQVPAGRLGAAPEQQLL